MYYASMAIRELYNQAVIGSERSDTNSALLQIRRPEINIATGYYPFRPETIAYFHALDIRKNFIQAGVGYDSGYGRDVAYYSFHKGRLRATGNNVLPEGPGLESLKADLLERSALMSEIVGHGSISSMIRLLDNNDYILAHVDNVVTYRGLETIIGEGRTLFMPDKYVDLNKFRCDYDEQGRMCSNYLDLDTSDYRHLREIEEHHMSIHKGAVFPNPCFHSAPGDFPEHNLRAGVRAIATFDIG